MTKGLEKLEGLETGDTVTVKFVASAVDADLEPKYGLIGISQEQITEIVSVEKKPKPLVGYVNVFRDSLGNRWSSKKIADRYSNETRLALLKITANPATGEYSIEEVKE